MTHPEHDRSTAVAILGSGAGSTTAAIMDALAGNGGRAHVVLAVSNNSGSGVLAHARERGVATRHLSGVTHPDPHELDVAMLGALREAGADLLVLAGYMKKVGPRVLEAYAGRIVNTHPALLPDYGGHGMYGDRVHAAVLADGVPMTGASVHVVTAEYDDGPVLAQVEVAVEPGDDVESLRTRVQSAEKDLLVRWLTGGVESRA